MLKAVLIDVFPIIISHEDINKFIWTSILKEDEIAFLTENEAYTHWFNEDLTIPETADKFLVDIKDVRERALDIIKQFTVKKSSLTTEYFKTFKFSESLMKFFTDAIDSQCVVILNNNEGKTYEKLTEVIKKPKGVFTATEYGLLSLETLEGDLSTKNIALTEFSIISSDQSKIDTLTQKGCFCVKIDSSGAHDLDESIHTISSIDDLDFGNLAFKFYDSEGSEDNGGL